MALAERCALVLQLVCEPAGHLFGVTHVIYVEVLAGSSLTLPNVWLTTRHTSTPSFQLLYHGLVQTLQSHTR